MKSDTEKQDMIQLRHTHTDNGASNYSLLSDCIYC